MTTKKEPKPKRNKVEIICRTHGCINRDVENETCTLDFIRIESSGRKYMRPRCMEVSN